MSSNSTSCRDVQPAAASSEQQPCYIHCNFCNIVLAVSVPCSISMFDRVRVRCGNCSNIWPLNLGMAAAFHHSLTASTSSFQDSSSSHDHQQPADPNTMTDLRYCSSNCNDNMKPRPCPPSVTYTQEMINNPPPEKRQRVPSLYNRFMKEEIQRIKASNPDFSHKKAFSTAAKNWAHFPHIQFDLRLENNRHQG